MDIGDLRFAVLTAFPSEDWHSARILAALGRLGEAVAVDPAELSGRLDEDGLTVTVGTEDAGAFDAFVLARGLSPRGDADVQFALYRALEERGHLILNRIESLLGAQDKFRTSLLLRGAGVPTPRAVAAQTVVAAARALQAWGECVLKPLAGSLGEGVERIGPGAEGEHRCAEVIEELGAVYLQEWVPNPGRDVRVFVVGGRAVGAVERIAPPGEFRTNVARGARAHAVEPSRAVLAAAEAAARALDLDYTGVDIIEGPHGPQVIEVNGNPAFDMIFDATGADMAEDIARHVQRRAVEARESGGGAARSRGGARPEWSGPAP